MPDWLTVLTLSLAAGLAMPVGAVIARFERIRPRWLEEEFRHSVIAFGGGALLSAVALVLVPEGSRGLPIYAVVITFAAGGVSFMALDLFLASRRKQASSNQASPNQASQLVAMLSDFIPEAIALGGVFAFGGRTGPLLAGLIALQNLPEGFNAYRELSASRSSGTGARVILAFCAMALLGPVAALLGYFWLSAYAGAVAAVMLFAAGGILYLIFEDIAPQARLERHWAPPLGAVAGFLLGLVGHMIATG